LRRSKFKNIFVLVSLILSLILLSNFAFSAIPVYDSPCCVPYYYDSTTEYPTSPTIAGCIAGTIKYNNCYYLEGRTPVWNPEVLKVGCCCNGEALVGFSNPQNKVTKIACLNNANYVFTEKSSCTLLDCAQNTGTTPPVNKYKLTGNVKGNISNYLTPLTNVDLDIYFGSNHLSTKTIGDGNYSFNNLIAGSYEVFVYDYFLETANKNYTCKQNSNTINIDKNSTLNFTLQCVETITGCTPTWYVGLWSDCDCYTDLNVCYQTREVTLSNGCYGDLSNKPISKQSCSGSILGTCNTQNAANLKIDSGEQCDRECVAIDPVTKKCRTYGNTYIYNTNVQGQTAPSLSCTNYYGFETAGNLNCTNSCILDTSNCVSRCTEDCQGDWQCEECDSCIGRTDVCTDSCEGQTPKFIKSNLVGLTSLSNGSTSKPFKNIFNMYAAFVEPSLFPGIKFFEGTKNVALNWNYNVSCSDYDGFIVRVAKTSLSNSLTEQDVKLYFTTGKNLTFENLLEPDYKYCFDVCVKKLDGSVLCSWENYFSQGGQPYEYGVCIETPSNDYCMNPHPEGMRCNFDTNSKIKCDTKYFETNGYNKNMINLLLNNAGCNDDICVNGLYNKNDVTNFPGAYCYDVGPCEKCNGLFGLFANYNLIIQEDGDDFECDTFQHTLGMRLNLLDDRKVGVCYKDESLSIAPQFDSCAKIKTCYDYNSSNACKNDPCFHFTGIDGTKTNTQSDCEWAEYNNELGIGVCRPKNVSEQDCTLCDTNSPIGYCNEDMCQKIYGGKEGDIPKCYFRDPSTNNEPSDLFDELFDFLQPPNRLRNPSCIAIEDMGCVMYDSKEDCVGNNTISSEISLNITYNEPTNIDGFSQFSSNEDGVIKIISGDNSKLTSSKDYFKFGTCQWDSINKYCYKNPTDNNEYLNEDDSFEEKLKEDCVDADDYLMKKCVVDNVPPNTTFIPRQTTFAGLPAYGVQNLKTLTFITEDNYWNQGTALIDNYITTYVTFISDSIECKACQDLKTAIPTSRSKAVTPPTPDPGVDYDYCLEYCGDVYPNKQINEISEDDFKKGSGVYLMKYFSQDYAYNLEEVKSAKIYLDVTGPKIDLTVLQITHKINNDYYKTDLNISFTTNELSYCSLELKDSKNTDYSTKGDIGNQFNTSFKTNYFALSDGAYLAKINCEDVYGNPSFKNEEITIEGDKSIYNATPRAKIYKTDDVLLYLFTINEAECRFDTEEKLFYDMQGKFNFASYKKATNVNGRIVYDPSLTTEKTNHSILLNDALKQLSSTYQYDSTKSSNIDSKTHYFYTACKNDLTGEITENDTMDSIYFTIDLIPPITELKIGSVVYKEENAQWSDSKQFKFKCNDDVDSDSVQSFGCKEVKYCLSDRNLVFDSLFDSKTSYYVATLQTHCFQNSFKNATYNSINEFDLLISESTCSNCYLFYYSVDKGNNIEQINIINPKIRDIFFDKPKLTVDGKTIEPDN
jgi:hypothetical protein